MTYIGKIQSYNIPSFGFNGVRTAPLKTPAFTPAQDMYVSNPRTAGNTTKEEIELIARSNPNIVGILRECNLPVKANERVLNDLRKGHLSETRVLAAKMYSALPKELKENVNLSLLQEAAMYHDYGKVFIPERILNKEGKLTDDEWKIMKRHAELGAELLKDMGLNKRSVELVKYHHQNRYGSGYPCIEGHYEFGTDSEILSAADKYVALTEKRSYKNALSKEDSLKIIGENLYESGISPEVYNALKTAVNS